MSKPERTRTATALRAGLAEPGVLRIAGAADGLSAILAEHSGFDGLWAGSLVVSASHGLPDAAILDLEDYVAVAEVMTRASSLPVLLDCDLNLPSATAIAHTVRECEARGVAALCLEDKKPPKRNSFLDDHHLTDVGEFAATIAIAKEAQTDHDFMIMARTEALIAGLGVVHAVERSEAYVAAGADVILVHSKADTAGEVCEFAAEWSRRGSARPLAVVPTSYHGVTVDELRAAGIKVVIYANQALRASVYAVRHTLETIMRTGSSSSAERSLVSTQEILSLLGSERWEELEARFRNLANGLSSPQTEG